MKMQDLREHLDDVQKKIGYWFDNEDLLLQAFTRSSYSSQHGGENNEVLEFLGDRVLDFYVVKVIADRFGFVKSQSDYYDEANDLYHVKDKKGTLLMEYAPITLMLITDPSVWRREFNIMRIEK